ncbi:hypothetical protein PIROE2DRAFT_64261 [Piromyces sp. E2]|nr:hypothetical protein PIROE2DRAFT_64261 [Piromyces sp. E2]|eukprot:OUM58660.1 hypothetical protein PIROE2DRAFT_64261 [Piromyces sp. E2]
MKFNGLFTLLLASSTLAYNIQKRDEFEDEAQKLSQTVDAMNEEIDNPLANPNVDTLGDTLGDQLGDQIANSSAGTTFGSPESVNPTSTDIKCQVVEEALLKCVGNKGTVDSFCAPFNTQECQDALKKDFSGCSDYEGVYGMALSVVRLTCAKDENGQYCPISKDQQNPTPRDIDDELIKETCKSKKCSEQARIAMKEMKGGYDTMNKNSIPDEYKKEFEKVQGYIDAFSEDKCSGATHIKVGSALLVAFVALILSHF